MLYSFSPCVSFISLLFYQKFQSRISPLGTYQMQQCRKSMLVSVLVKLASCTYYALAYSRCTILSIFSLATLTLDLCISISSICGSNYYPWLKLERCISVINIFSIKEHQTSLFRYVTSICIFIFSVALHRTYWLKFVSFIFLFSLFLPLYVILCLFIQQLYWSLTT